MARKYKDDGGGDLPTSSDKVHFKVLPRRSFVCVFYRVPTKEILSYMEERVEKTTTINPMTFPYRRMSCINYHLTSNPILVYLNDVFRGHLPRMFWMTIVDDQRYQGSFGKNPFDFTDHTLISVECTANGVPVPKASLDVGMKHDIYDLLLNASGKRKRDAYLLDPETFHHGYLIIPFDLTAMQDGGELDTPLHRMLVNMRLTFKPSQPALQVLFFYNTDESDGS